LLIRNPEIGLIKTHNVIYKENITNMPETKDEEEKRKLKELEGKNIAHYQVLLSAWIETRMERDKTIITLSAAAIALLVTIITAVHINGLWQYLFATIAFAGFIIASCSCLHIYQINAKHIEEALRDEHKGLSSSLLKNLDILSLIGFYVGVGGIILMAIFVSFQKTGGLAMSDKKQDVSKKIVKIQESLNGIKKLSPKDIETASLNGINNLSPQNLKPSSSNSSQDSGKTQSGEGNSGEGGKK
jgi:hypothetical protein